MYIEIFEKRQFMEWVDVIMSTIRIKAERGFGLLCVLSLTLTVFSKEKRSQN